MSVSVYHTQYKCVFVSIYVCVAVSNLYMCVCVCVCVCVMPGPICREGEVEGGGSVLFSGLSLVRALTKRLSGTQQSAGWPRDVRAKQQHREEEEEEVGEMV